ncbi:unnamed protein product [Cuscuta campestris]|uniref:Transposase (putative) gypsy type domain-containing protein n=1 Tax=Cuscuta campestris TaxID=132261 RepID=A0A484N6R9_9ASTE|nr:unnamed protein product [Cuscuta campestris]
MSSSDSQGISSSDAYASEESSTSSDAYASEESSTSSSSTGSSLSGFETRSGPNITVLEPQPVNQMPGQVFQERDEPVDNEPAPYDPDNESYEGWANRLEAAGYSPLPTSYPSDIFPHVSKIAQNKVRRNLPEGYVLEFDPSWPNIIEPHRDDRIGFHITSLESGTVFPLRPLLVELCHCFKILHGQITPNAHRFLNAFVNICVELKIDPSLRLFLVLFEVLPEMNFKAFNIPTKKTGGSSSAAPKTVPVQQEPVEIHSEEETPPTGRTGQAGKTTVNPPLDKGKGKVRTKHAATTHPSAKRKRGENVPATESLEELWVKMGRKLKEMGEVGPETLERLAGDSPSRANAEVLQLKEENTLLMGEVSHLKEEAWVKEQELPSRARQWMEENLVEAARVLTSSGERTMEGFKLLYREDHGKEMITQIGSYGFMSGQKRDQEATHAILADRDPDFDADSYGLAPIRTKNLHLLFLSSNLPGCDRLNRSVKLQTHFPGNARCSCKTLNFLFFIECNV